MHCDEARERIGPFLDGELLVDERQAMAAHLEACLACRRQAEDVQRLGRQVAMAGREPAPKALALRVRAALSEEAEAQVKAPAAATAVRLSTSVWRQAAALAAVAVLSSALTWSVLAWRQSQQGLEGEILSAHMRSLVQDSPIQVASSDQHTVKPWFAGRVDFAPDVKDLTAEGFPLAGARLDYVGERRIGALVYKRRLHVINVFMWPASSGDAAPPRPVTLKGFNLVTWSRNGVTYWAVSDLNAGELRQLQSLL